MRFRLCATALVLALTGLSLLGCGGGSSSSNTQNLTGKYEGTFSGLVNGVADTGTLTITVASNGNITGTAFDNVTNTSAIVTGTLSSADAFADTSVYPSVTYTAKGTVSKTSAQHLVGTLTEFNGTTSIGTITIDLSPG